jgi:hypothetical protein
MCLAIFDVCIGVRSSTCLVTFIVLPTISLFFYFFILLVALEFELKDLCLLASTLTLEPCL